MKSYDIAIIGGGAAGMMAAIFASKKNKSVVLIEKNDRLGRKVLATGNGRCNLTNTDITVDRYHGSNPKFIKSVLYQFDQNQTMELFENLGVLLKVEDKGRVFPRTDQASTIVNVFEQKLNENDVEILLNSQVNSISKNNDEFAIELSNGKITAKKIILTTGGKAAHYLGSSGDGLYFAQKLGHTITPVYAALVPVATEEAWVRQVSGVKVLADVSIIHNNQKVSEAKGDLLFTHFGASGPAIMAQSRCIAPLIQSGKVFIQIDLMPEIEESELNKKIAKILETAGKKTVKNALIGILPQSLLEQILKLSNILDTQKAAELSKDKRKSIISNIKSLSLTVNDLRPLKDAQVTAGGIDCKEVDPQTLESKIVRGLFFAGEILDVDGDSGGFNLQWAWSSGYVAGKSALN